MAFTLSDRPMSTFQNRILVCCLAYTGPAAAAGSGRSDEHTVTIFIAEIALMLLVGRLLAELMQRIGQPAVIGQLLAGILMGPSVLGAIWPDAYQVIFPDNPAQKKMIDAISQLGILMLLLLTGMETDLGLVREKRRTAFYTSLCGIALPFAAGFALGQLLPESLLRDPAQRLLTSLFLATALSISSVKIVAVVLMEVDFFRRNIGQIIMATAILDDTIAWLLIAIIGGVALHGDVDLAGISMIVVATLAFLWFSLTIGRRIVAFLIRWTNDHLVIEMPVLTTILIVMFVMALITDYIGMHTVLGAFVAGILIGQSPILTAQIDEQLRGLIVALFMPVFFAVAGLSIDISVITKVNLMELAVGIILVASLGKMLGCYLGGRLGGLTGRESLALGLGMNARGSTEVLVASVGLSMGILTHDLYTLIVFMAVLTTMIMPPMLKWALARIPPTEEEQIRLEHEELEAKEFVPNVERLLVAADASENGKLASCLAGLLAGSRQITTTVLELSAVQANEKADSGRVAEIVKASVELAIRNRPAGEHEEKEAVAPPSLTAQTSAEEISEAVLQETKKGYGMVFLGMEHALADADLNPGHFNVSIEKIVDSYEGAMAIALAHGDRDSEQHPGALNILVPTTGADYSRRAVEVAMALARASGGVVTALYVTPQAPPGMLSRLIMGINIPQNRQEPVETELPLVENVRALGERYGVTVVPEMIEGLTVEDAVLSLVNRRHHDLVVLGAKARPGEGLFFGVKTAAILEHLPSSCLVISS